MEIFQPGLKHLREERQRQQHDIAYPTDGADPLVDINLDAGTATILIPTRDRASTLGACVETCLAQEYAALEVIVSDNASGPETAEVLARFSDPRLKVLRQDKRLSMRANFDVLANAATGDYVIIIGDDDGIMPGAISAMARYLSENDVDVLNWPGLVYSWPGVLAPGVGLMDFKIRRLFGTLEHIDPQERFRRLLKGRLRTYLDGSNLYHGCIKRSVIEASKAKAGHVFPLHVPDVYACMGFLPYARSMAYFHHPLSIAGVSGASHGFSYQADIDPETGKREPTPAERFALEANADPVVARPYNPYLRSTQYHAAISLLHASTLLGREAELDLDAWVEIIIAEARKFCNLTQVIPTLDPGFELDRRLIARIEREGAALNVEPVPVVGKSARRQRFGRLLLRSARAGEDTVMTAFRTLELLLGKPTIASASTMARTLRWLALRTKSATIRFREGKT